MIAPRSVPALYSEPGSTHTVRLSFEDRGTKSRAADRNQDLLSSPHNRAWRVRGRVELRGDVQPGLIGRCVHQVDAASGILHAAKKWIETSLEAILRQLPRRVPRRRIRPSKSKDLMVLIEPGHLLVDVVDVRR